MESGQISDCHLFRLQGTKSVLFIKAFQVGSLAKYFPLFAKRHAGSQNRSEACVFPSEAGKRIATVCQNPGRPGHLRVPGSLFWAKHTSTNLDGSNEGFQKPLAKKRKFLFHLPGRHFGREQHQTRSAERSQLYDQHFAGSWNGNKLQEKHLGTGEAFRLQSALQK